MTLFCNFYVNTCKKILSLTVPIFYIADEKLIGAILELRRDNMIPIPIDGYMVVVTISPTTNELLVISDTTSYKGNIPLHDCRITTLVPRRHQFDNTTLGNKDLYVSQISPLLSIKPRGYTYDHTAGTAFIRKKNLL